MTTEDCRDAIPRHVFLARSTDSGRTFTITTVFKVEQGHPYRDNRGVVAEVDPNDPRRFYVGWRQGAYSSESQKLKNPIAASADGGKTFESPVDITDEHGADHPWLAVGREGSIHESPGHVASGRPTTRPAPDLPQPLDRSRQDLEPHPG
ncbi:MAG: hypothetical protein ACRDQ2_04465 [Gaiellales bacterium]